MSRDQGHVRIACVMCALLLLQLLSATASAQIVQLNQAYLTRTQELSQLTPGGTTTEPQTGEIVPSPNDSDLGEQQILKRVESYRPFSVMVSAPFYWTSNVALTNTGEQTDFIVAPVAAVMYEPRITPTLAGLVSVRQQMFYYNEFDEFNFGSFDFEIGLRYLVPQWHNLLLRVEYDYNRLTERDSFDDFYSNHSIIANAELPFQFGRAQTVSLGVTANVSATADPEEPRRNDYEAYVFYSANVTRAFTVSAAGRVVVRDYYHMDSRVDVSEILSVGATYWVTKYLNAGVIGTFAASQSNHSVFDYQVANVGGMVSLWLNF